MSHLHRVSAHIRLLLFCVLSSIALAAAGAAAAQVPLLIPLGTTPSHIDGVCDPAGEWSDALALPYADVPTAAGNRGMLWLKHDGKKLYLCVRGASTQAASSFFDVFFDTEMGHLDLPGRMDYGLRTEFPSGTRSSFHGTDTLDYAPMTTQREWLSAAKSSFFDIFTEVSVDGGLTGGGCGKPFGLAIFHRLSGGINDPNTADDYGWPAGAGFNKPSTWMPVQLGSLAPCSGKSNIAFIYKFDTVGANDFRNLLTPLGFTVDLIPQSAIMVNDLGNYDVIIVADDTGSLDIWDVPGGDGGAAIAAIIGAGTRPILGLGEGGYAFFGKLGSPIGWPHGWHQVMIRESPTRCCHSAATVQIPSPIPAYYYADPYDLSGLDAAPGRLVMLLSASGNPFSQHAVSIYSPGTLPSGMTVLGGELPATPAGTSNHAPLVNDGCRQLWGFSGSPADMTEDGRRLFVNAVFYSRFHSTCAPPPPVNCLTLTKAAQPPDGSTVQPGDAITYTLSYTVADNPLCTTKRALLVDPVPDHSLYIPGTGGTATGPNADGALEWNLSPLAAGAQGGKSFKISVLDTACRSGVITNTAMLQTDTGTLTSNTVLHKVDCPPVVPPNVEPPYAESELQIYPYPLFAGALTQISVRLYNNSAVPQTVTVTFQTSNGLGIGIPYTSLAVPGNPRVVTLGALAYVEVLLDWTPASSGHAGIRAKIEGAGYAPIYTSRNLDVTEDLKPGLTDALTFAVANPGTVAATITLVVVNACPGWTAAVNPAQIVNAVPGTVYSATLSATPPGSGTVGSGCHIDVQGWLGNQLIGGIRKLDVPPVNLPRTDPPWLEREISTIPTVPVAGILNQACIELQNPLAFARVVTVAFREADFGAGIPFTLFATQTFTLPPNSLAKYCVDWTPVSTGTLHRCLLVELGQGGWQTQRSQRNLQIVQRPPVFDPGTVSIPFSIGNPHPFPGKVRFDGILIGMNQWRTAITNQGGFDTGTMDIAIGVGETLNFTLKLVPAVQMAAEYLKQSANAVFPGDVMRADIAVSLNGQPAAGFSVEFTPPPKVLDIDGNGTYDPLTDGLLVIRSLFGLTGAPLINGAIGPGAKRDTDTLVGNYLAAIKPSLDIDGNNQADALTDGLVIIRYMFGMRGAELIARAIGNGAIRTTADAIETQIQLLTP